MGRSKVKLAYIENKSDRKTTYGKRSKCLLKKTSELSTMCNVQACAILYGPYSSTPEVWPSVDGAQEVLTRFRSMTEYQKGANEANLESFTNKQIKKQEAKLVKDRMLNYQNDMTCLMYKRMRGDSTSKASLEDLSKMGSIAGEKIRKIAERIEMIKLRESANASHDGNRIP